MANIHTLTSQGQGITLGPVTIEKTFPSRPGAKNHFFLISDGSGKGALKIWGPDPRLSEGQSVTITGYGPKGGLKISEYQGKTSIDANDCNVVINDGSAAASQPAQEDSYAAPAQSAQVRVEAVGSYPAVVSEAAAAKMQTTSKAASYWLHLLVEDLVLQGFSKDEAIMLAPAAGGHALWWFGEKGT